MIDQSQYQEALENPKYRQKFVDSLDLEGASKYVKKVSYLGFGENIVMYVMPGIRHKLGIRGVKSTIFVMKHAFDKSIHPKLEDFLSNLIDHEGHHAKELYENPVEAAIQIKDLINLLLKKDRQAGRNMQKVEIAREIRAIRNQMRMSETREISEQYKEFLRSNYISYLHSAELILLKDI